MLGKSIAINFDMLDQNNCKVIVQGDDDNWVDSSYSSLIGILGKLKNYHVVVRNSITPFIVQVGGVILGVLLSIKGAQWLEPKLDIEYALPFSFVIVFLLFSNVWTYFYNILLRFLGHLWPNVSCKEKQSNMKTIFQWGMNIVLATIFLAGITAIGLFILNTCSSLFK